MNRASVDEAKSAKQVADLSSLTFGLEQTFTIEQWWQEPGFVATSDTPLKRQKMLELAEAIAKRLNGRFIESADIYKHLQYETFDSANQPSFVVTMDPGSIEVKTPPMFLGDVKKTMEPLYLAAADAQCVPYRNWWYGVKKGTEGGCHVNMAGLEVESNPLAQNALLVLQYAAFFHNHPCIQIPFMGVDVGPGGNCMRMDENDLHVGVPGDLPGSDARWDSVARYEALRQEIELGKLQPRQGLEFAKQVSDWFKGSKVMEDKHSAPSLYKFKPPHFFIEDRAVESLWTAEECELVCSLRHKIFQYLAKTQDLPELLSFGLELYQQNCFSETLWRDFVKLAAILGVNSQAYRVFFDRQFPVLHSGAGSPSKLKIREGRRPRVITDVKMRGDLVISKTVDTSYGRLEIHWPKELSHTKISISGCQVGEIVNDRMVAVDYRRPRQDAILVFELFDGTKLVERCAFHLGDMMFKHVTPELESLLTNNRNTLELKLNSGTVLNAENLLQLYF